ncbi:MarR family winged helix-turn-helix transcriptional regulator [Crossiella cryophila]|uniref:DNA-binding MarR family transcriptional regulator n=1 Tax=Crossiella cryophila TaxID=43355 RepID=A0A7W7CJR6_9PSEU|nr:MarR family winged helix-turn-helix transcriptional regulator [Crossiella cryophila]MBB4680749.1 DNA-binding MarR family transcriptional regulator [Crossiella cryophila]
MNPQTTGLEAGDLGAEPEHAEIGTAKQAAADDRVLVFGRLLGAANRLEHILGREIEAECGISHLMFEVLLILGRAGEPGLPMRRIAQEQVLTTGGATRLVDRMVRAGLVERVAEPGDRRVHLVRLTEAGERTAVTAARLHARNVQRYLLDALPADERELFAAQVKLIGHAARDALPPLG